MAPPQPITARVAALDLGKVLQTNAGLEENSYAKNSVYQLKRMETVKAVIISTALECYASLENPQRLVMADLGCSTGLNSLILVGEIMSAITDACNGEGSPLPELVAYLNDLPSNDFNTMFMSFPEFINELKHGGGGLPVFLAGVPGSFYGRLFPRNSLHFINSCYSLHWLSQVPPALFDKEGRPINKGKVYISEASSPAVAKAYFEQFQEDFNLFLRSRSVELIAGGRMVLIMSGRRNQDHQHEDKAFVNETLAQALAIMVSEGRITEEKVDSYNVPFYSASLQEIEDEVHREGSFAVDYAGIHEFSQGTGDAKVDGKRWSMLIRTTQESMINHHFGEGIIDDLVQICGKLFSDALEKENGKGFQTTVVLRKLP